MKNPSVKPAVTIYDIARHVNLSAAAVSSALANRHVERRLSPTTVQRIRDAAQELGYVPNMAGRRLRKQSSAGLQYDLAILTSFEAPLPLVAQALGKLQTTIDSLSSPDVRYSVVIEMFHAGRLSEKPELLDANRYHGVLLTNTLPVDDDYLTKAHLPYPLVVLGRRIPGYCCVLEASELVGRKAAEVLADSGCRQPAVLHGRLLTYTTLQRLESFKEKVRGLFGKDPVIIVSEGLQPHHGVEALTQFFDLGGKFDGLFAITDSLATGAYLSIKTSGRKIPRDVSVVGIGDYGVAEYFDPPLTTVAGANEAMVAEAIPLLFSLVRGETTPGQPLSVFPPTILRGSTKKAK